MEQNQSMIRQLVQEIEARFEAARRGLYGPAQVASHLAITRRMEVTGQFIAELQHEGRDEEAQALLLSDALWDGREQQ